jgi:hypothetical protein
MRFATAISVALSTLWAVKPPIWLVAMTWVPDAERL